MFTLSAMPVKFVVLLVLFAATVVWEATRLAAPRPGHPSRGSAAAPVSHAMHLVMGLLMLAMVPRQLWMPLHRAVGLPVMIGAMTVCLLWFLGQAIGGWRQAGHRAHALGCAGMFAAMVWHLTAMWRMMSHPMTSMAMPGMDHAMNHSMEHGPMQAMPVDDWMTAASRPGGELWWFAVVGVVIMAGLLWMAVRDLALGVRTPAHRWGHLAGFAMNFGMFWMSTGLLTPVLPFFRYLSF